MRDYELTFILTTNLDEEASAAAVERVNTLITNGGGSITEVHAWGRRHLAYPIQHQRDGFYVTTRFAMPPETVNPFERDLRLNENILRHLLIDQNDVPIRPVTPVAAPAPASQTSAPVRERVLDDDEIMELEDADLVPAADE